MIYATVAVSSAQVVAAAGGWAELRPGRRTIPNITTIYRVKWRPMLDHLLSLLCPITMLLLDPSFRLRPVPTVPQAPV